MMTPDVRTTQIIYDVGELLDIFKTRTTTPTQVNAVTESGSGYIFRLNPNVAPSRYVHDEYGEFFGRTGQFVVDERPGRQNRDPAQQGGFLGWIGINAKGEFLLDYKGMNCARRTTRCSVAFV